MKNEAENTLKKLIPSLKLNIMKISLRNVPLIYQTLYEFDKLEINRQPFLLIKVKDKNLGPKHFKKHSTRLSEIINYPQIWFLYELHSHKVFRMIANEMNFIIENKQVHLPTLNSSIRLESEKVKFTKKLSGLSINLIIHEILRNDLSGKRKIDLAKIFNSSKMSMGRALEPLLATNLCKERKIGVAKKIQFENREKLWDFVSQNLKSPVCDEVFLKKIPKGLPQSGITALSNLSMLADESIPTFAIDRKDYINKFKTDQVTIEDDAQAKLEIWDRPITHVNDININIIDLFLILNNSPDERLQIELIKLLNKHNLKLETK